MKKIFLTVAVICVVFLASSCKKDSNGNSANSMSASIGGTQWSALIPAGVLSNGVLVITGTSLTGQSIIVTVYGQTAGTYNLSVIPPKAECLGTYKATLTATSEDTYVSTTGSVILTKVDLTNKLVSGTFEFTAANSTLVVKQITAGTFTDVTFITQ